MSRLQLGLPKSPLFLKSNPQKPFLLHYSTSYSSKDPSFLLPRTGKLVSVRNFRFTVTAVSGDPDKSRTDLVVNGKDHVVKDKSVSVILLAGGTGTRMGASIPKQYLPLLGQPIALYSFYTFSKLPQVKEIVVVCDPLYHDVFEDAGKKMHIRLKFALPGKERQDSVYSGFQEADLNSELICVHDSARPLVLAGDVEKVLRDGCHVGAAVLGVPAKSTMKEANNESFVVKTLDRKTLWEMQTPQVIKPELLAKGFELIHREGLEVTDDVSIVEHLKHPVYITSGSYTNIKVTTPDDMLVAERILHNSIQHYIPTTPEISNNIPTPEISRTIPTPTPTPEIPHKIPTPEVTATEEIASVSKLRSNGPPRIWYQPGTG